MMTLPTQNLAARGHEWIFRIDHVHFGSCFLFIRRQNHPVYYPCKYAVCSVSASPCHCAIFSKYPGIGSFIYRFQYPKWDIIFFGHC